MIGETALNQAAFRDGLPRQRREILREGVNFRDYVLRGLVLRKARDAYSPGLLADRSTPTFEERADGACGCAPELACQN